ncbi:MAG TPA: hypothetical protein VES65_07485 [Solirubrobacteraceae bacterium]|nr:hypothetical protein [Solirubrobacteraceae bacterium]
MRIAIGAAVAAVAALALAQALGPGIAAERVRERVGRYGTVKSVKVKAWPAVKLLWGNVDEVRVKAGALKLSVAQTAGLVAEAKGTARVDASAEVVREGPLRLRDVHFEKRGSELRGEGVMSEGDVKEALPPGFDVTLVGSEGGAVEVKASGGLFGMGASVEAVAKAQEGKLVAQPKASQLEGLELVLFADPRVYVEGVEAREVRGTAGEGAAYRLSMWASLK